MQTENFEFIDDEYIEKQILFQELQDNLTNNYECKKDENPNIISTKPTEQKSDQNKNKYSQLECENNLDEKKNNFTQKKTEREKQEPRKDNIFKQIKVKVIKFGIDTMNYYHIDKINRFYNFKNKIEKVVKERLKKEFNLEILESTIEEILIKYSENEFNKKVIVYIYDNLEKEKDNDDLNFVFNFLKMKFIDVIKLFALSKEEYYNKFGYYNQFLLENSSYSNKKDMKDLIELGMIEYLNEKTGRNIKKKGCEK